MRDIGGFVDTRHKLLGLKPGNRGNWVAFAVGHHLDGNHELAAQIISAYEQTQVGAAGRGARHAAWGSLISLPRSRLAASSPFRCCPSADWLTAAPPQTGSQLPLCSPIHPTRLPWQEDVPASEAYEHSEVLMYKAQVRHSALAAVGGQGQACGGCEGDNPPMRRQGVQARRGPCCCARARS